ncbi:MAG: glycosyltransferase [Lachnospiraceae bacterium]|nr:glycosyltransferase [Lachnospiraceae bacterium]
MIQTKYAIVIVTYNREQLLHECIENVQKQTIQASSIIIVNNASTDTTSRYLETLEKENTIYDIVNLPENIGGAGGFTKGIERSLEKNVDCVLLIDDDAMIAEDYMEQILQARQSQPEYQAFAGTVKTNNTIDIFHRRTISKVGLLFHNCSEEEYQQPYFLCEVASFCGMVLDISLIKQIGLPHAEYFIWHDDAEYSLRVRKYGKFLVVTNAVLNHKTKQNTTTFPRRYNWKDYYAVRNRIWMLREHGTLADRFVNWMDLFIHVIFRNWLFGVVKRDGYDWKNEKDMVKKAVRDADKLNM